MGFFWVFPFLNPEWYSKFEWMSGETRFTLGSITVILDLIIGCAIVFACMYLTIERHMWYIPVGIILAYLGYGAFCLARNVYRQYREAHPIPDNVLEKKKSIFRFSRPE